MSDLKSSIKDDMKTAMRAKDTLRLGTIRMLLAAIQKHEIDAKTTLDDAGVLKIVSKQIKQRHDSITQFEAAERQELADKEKAELSVLEAYMPEQLDETTIQQLVTKAVQDTGADSMKDMGKVMAALKSQIDGQADMGLVSKLVREALS